MTEEEAKTKWCPFVRFTGKLGYDLAPNRSERGEDTTRCIGSACMAWREHRKTVVTRDDGSIVGPGEVYLVDKSRSEEVVIGGHCGLAGPVAGAPQ